MPQEKRPWFDPPVENRGWNRRKKIFVNAVVDFLISNAKDYCLKLALNGGVE